MHSSSVGGVIHKKTRSYVVYVYVDCYPRVEVEDDCVDLKRVEIEPTRSIKVHGGGRICQVEVYPLSENFI